MSKTYVGIECGGCGGYFFDGVSFNEHIPEQPSECGEWLKAVLAKGSIEKKTSSEANKTEGQ